MGLNNETTLVKENWHIYTLYKWSILTIYIVYVCITSLPLLKVNDSEYCKIHSKAREPLLGMH